MKRVASLAAVLLLAMVAQANGAIIHSATISGWKVYATTKDDGSFFACSASAPYNSGYELIFYVLADGNWAVMISGGDIRPSKDQAIRLSLRIGAGPLWNLEGKTATKGINGVFAIISGTNEQLFEELRRGYVLRAYFLGKEVSFNLDGTSRMLEYVSYCAGYYAGMETVEALPLNDNGFTASPKTQPLTSGLSEQQARAAVVPYVRAATDCVADRIVEDPRFDTFAREGRALDLSVDAINVCGPKLRAMIGAHDRFYWPGKGAEFASGAYADDLPRAVNERLKPHIALALAKPQERPAPKEPVESAPVTEPKSSSQPSKRMTSFGSGFFVRADGTGLTNAHVVGDCRSAIIEGHGEARIIARDKTNDLALVRPLASVRTEAVQFARRPAKLGEFVYALGFPLAGIIDNGLNFTGGSISSLSGIDSDSRKIQISAPIQPGNSGGPVVNTSGQLVGVTVSRLDDVVVLKESGAIPQNVNYAIRSDIAASFLRAQDIDPLESEVATKLEPTDIATSGRGYTFQIKCTSER